ncbi:hypothetical protein A3K55_02705 [Candidatus Shapirobacteria bacterium RBG_13_44_7]|uniref:Uncharacterized protein n=1 Tax=Candidatus Shapirobacteria bacterium RBG_13_44_7 TaxID=1802149 RepID=A0A1F7SG79_9BACT|nr:MAG: hypothetical protein A3K55_02705 [Candidatus Shapirobacteria bacterium RBG_13_44_7]
MERGSGRMIINWLEQPGLSVRVRGGQWWQRSATDGEYYKAGEEHSRICETIRRRDVSKN